MEKAGLMKNSSKIIVVFGATGLQGDQVVKHLLSSNWKVRAITRNPESDAAKRLINLNIEVFKADMKYPESLLEPLKGAYGIFSVQNFWEVGFKDKITMGENVVDAAQKTAVKHLVYTSVGGA